MDIETSRDKIMWALESMNCGFVARDSVGMVLYANSGLLQWLQYERSEVEGKVYHRVRVGPVANRREADAMVESLQTQTGYQGQALRR